MIKEDLQTLKEFIEHNNTIDDICAGMYISEEELRKALKILEKKNYNVLESTIEEYEEVDGEFKEVQNTYLHNYDMKLGCLDAKIQKECPIEDLASDLKITKLQVLGMINDLKRQGNNVISLKKDGTVYFINYGDRKIEGAKSFKLIKDDKVVKIALISNTSLGSKYEQLTILNDIYKKAASFGITDIFHCGDLSAGIYKGTKKIYLDTLFAQDAESQCDYIIKNYPYVEGIETHFILGDKDITHLTKDKIDIGKKISEQREDMNYLGCGDAKTIICNSDNRKMFDIRTIHPTTNIKKPYTISYNMQQYISAMRNEDKTDILAQGHWNNEDRLVQRNIHAYSVPGLSSSTPEMLSRREQNTIGAIYLAVVLDKNYKIERIVPNFSTYYKTIEDDYLKAKTLKIGGRH